MDDRNDPLDNDPTLPRDSGGFREDPATQGLKDPPFIEVGEDSGEWTRGGGTDTNETGESEEDGAGS
jgi:hypothetical protein